MMTVFSTISDYNIIIATNKTLSKKNNHIFCA